MINLRTLISALCLTLCLDLYASVPNKAGMNVKGSVMCDGKPVAGVRISDGHEIVTTDSQGNYWLSSDKRNGWVYVSIPSGYEAPIEHSLPQFWASLNEPVGVCEEHNFTLKKVNNEKYVLFAVTDMHLANKFDDVAQFSTGFIPSITKAASEEGKVPVYSINLGDMSFDIYWYSDRYPIESYKGTITHVKYPTPLFHVVGNHDNDGAVPSSDSTDYLAVRRYCKAFGPNYYSFNIGLSHYVVLDDIVYLNEPGGKKSEKIAGARNYKCKITSEQLDWLRRDLEGVKDKTAPLFIAMHASLFSYKGASDTLKLSNFAKDDADSLLACLTDFSNIHFLTGHRHTCNTVYAGTSFSTSDGGDFSAASGGGLSPADLAGLGRRIDKPGTITEHNIGSVCGSWWVTGDAFGQNLCPDASPAGFCVLHVDGKNVDWQYRSVEDGGGKQFRAYDMNTVREFYRTSPEAKKFIEHYPHRDFSNIDDNLVYINIWDWAPDWKVSVTENGKPLKVLHERLEDPLYARSYHFVKTSNGNYPASYEKSLINHMFMVRASKPNSTIEIKVTDHFGRVYREKMIRPKAFTTDMK